MATSTSVEPSACGPQCAGLDDWVDVGAMDVVAHPKSATMTPAALRASPSTTDPAATREASPGMSEPHHKSEKGLLARAMASLEGLISPVKTPATLAAPATAVEEALVLVQERFTGCRAKTQRALKKMLADRQRGVKLVIVAARKWPGNPTIVKLAHQILSATLLASKRSFPELNALLTGTHVLGQLSSHFSRHTESHYTMRSLVDFASRVHVEIGSSDGLVSIVCEATPTLISCLPRCSDSESTTTQLATLLELSMQATSRHEPPKASTWTPSLAQTALEAMISAAQSSPSYRSIATLTKAITTLLSRFDTHPSRVATVVKDLAQMLQDLCDLAERAASAGSHATEALPAGSPSRCERLGPIMAQVVAAAAAVVRSGGIAPQVAWESVVLAQGPRVIQVCSTSSAAGLALLVSSLYQLTLSWRQATDGVALDAGGLDALTTAVTTATRKFAAEQMRSGGRDPAAAVTIESMQALLGAFASTSTRPSGTALSVAAGRDWTQTRPFPAWTKRSCGLGGLRGETGTWSLVWEPSVGCDAPEEGAAEPNSVCGGDVSVVGTN